MTTPEGLVRFFRYVPLIVSLGVLSGCNSAPQIRQSQNPTLQPSPLPSLSPTPVPTSSPTPQAKPVIFTLSVLDPLSELKIKTGMFIQKGQIIADQTNERLLLSTQKKNIESQLETLSRNRLVNTTTEQEEQAIAIAREQKSLAEAALNNYQQDSPWTDFARTNLPLAQEEVKLNRLESDVKRAQLNLEVAESKLEQKKTALQNFQQTQATQKIELQKALVEIEQKLLSLKPIPAPQSGTVTKIDFPNQTPPGQPVKVTVTLIPGLTAPKKPEANQPTADGSPPPPNNLPSSPLPNLNTDLPTSPELQ